MNIFDYALESHMRGELSDSSEIMLYRAMLKRLEWICVGESGEGQDVIICPDCQNEQKEGHKPDCELAAMLRGGVEKK
jgi:hypothetical protein